MANLLLMAVLLSHSLYISATLEASGALIENEEIMAIDEPLRKLRRDVGNHQLVLQEISGVLNKHLLTYSSDVIPSEKPEMSYLRQDCADIYKVEDIRVSGIYTVYPDRKTGVRVYCDMETTGGGWTVFQRRQDGSVNFNQSWAGYKAGFGDLAGEFWLGNDNLATLTALKLYTLRIDLQDFDREDMFAEYNDFLVLNEDRKYRLIFAAFDSYKGTAGDSLWPHAGHAFSTWDRDHDVSRVQHCARHTGAGFWFYSCQLVGLNGKYSYIPQVQHGQGIVWRSWHGSAVSLKKTEMKYRPIDY